MPVRLLLVDDHVLFRESLAHLLADCDWTVVGQCSTAEAALAALAVTPIDLVLLDFDLGDGYGFEVIRRARDAGHRGRFLIVTGVMDARDIVKALGYGVCGMVLKSSPPEALLTAIPRVMAGETWLDPECVRALSRAVQSPAEGPSRRQITQRERDVVKGVLSGQSNKEIAASLDISEGSVKAALQQLFVKSGVRTRSQLVRVAIEEYGTIWRLQ